MRERYHSVFRSDLFSEQTIVVTGGGSGMGRCIAHELASLGAKVTVVGRTESTLDRVVSEIRDDGGTADYAICDVRDEQRVKLVVDQILDRAPIDGLVNCAGGQFPALLTEMSANAFDSVLRNNLLSTFIVSNAVFLGCMQEHGGAIVNITASVRGGMPLMAHTGAARAGVENLTATAALEWAEFGIRVNAVAPGYVGTSGFDTYTHERMINALTQFG